MVANRPFAMWTLRQSKAIQNMQFGIRANLGQFTQQLVQVLLVGLTIGMMRNVVPALAESEFGVPRGSFMLLVAFVVAFGFVKGTMNFVAGRMAERLGRKQVLLLGWLVALPIPPLVYFAGSWSWIVLATILLGVNQGLTWSMTRRAWAIQERQSSSWRYLPPLWQPITGAACRARCCSGPPLS